MKSGHGSLGEAGSGSGDGAGRWTGLLLSLVVWLMVNRQAVQLSPAALCLRKG